MPTLVNAALVSKPALWLDRVINDLATVFPLFGCILFGFYLGSMVWGSLGRRHRSLRALIPFSC